MKNENTAKFLSGFAAIVGRPNVGKSQLFNRLAGKRLSIVEDTPGVTRDRLYADSDWRGRDFTVIDTGGIEPSNDNEILQFMRFQAETAISHAQVFLRRRFQDFPHMELPAFSEN